MKYSTGILATVTLIAAFVMPSCDRPSNNVENAETSVVEANRDLEIARTELESELGIYRSEHANRIKGNNRTIGELKQQINTESDSDIRERHELRLEEYEQTNSELKREIDNYKVSNRENWDDFKDSFSGRMEALGDSLDNFFTNSGTTTSIN